MRNDYGGPYTGTQVETPERQPRVSLRSSIRGMSRRRRSWREGDGPRGTWESR